MSQEVKKYTPEFKQKAIKSVRKGKSISEVAVEVGVSRATLNRWVNAVLERATKQESKSDKIIADKPNIAVSGQRNIRSVPQETPQIIGQKPVGEITSELVAEPKEIFSEVIVPKVGTTLDIPFLDWVKINAEALVKEAFMGLFEREIDQPSLEVFADVLRENPQMSQVLMRLIKSQEFVAKSLMSLEFQQKIQSVLETLVTHLGGVKIGVFHEVASNKSIKQLLISAMSRVSLEIEDHFFYLHQNPGVYFHYSHFSRLSSLKNLGIIFIADEAWLPFALAIAGYVHTQYQLETVLVYGHWSPGIAAAATLCASVFDVISLQKLKELPQSSMFSPKIIISHSYGWKDETTYLLKTFPMAAFFIYADGFKNEVSIDLNQHKIIGGAIFFEYEPQNKPINALTIIPAKAVLLASDKISAIYKFQPSLSNSKFENYAVVYLRYWGKGDYKFTFEEVMQCFYDTITRYITPSTVVVIKNDKRADQMLFPEIRKLLVNQKYTVFTFEEYLLQHQVDIAYQALPVEYFLARGLLCDAKTHVVFDSSIGFILATHPNVRRETNIVIGAVVDTFKEKIEFEPELSEKEIETQLYTTHPGLYTISYYSKQYTDAIFATVGFRNCELIESKGNFLFYIVINRQTVGKLLEIVNSDLQTIEQKRDAVTVFFANLDLNLISNQQFVFPAFSAQILNLVGKKIDNYIQSTQQSGFVMYGPYLNLGKGQYIARIFTEFPTKVEGQIKLDVISAGGKIHSAITLNQSELVNEHILAVSFIVELEVQRLEVRMRISETVDVIIYGLTISRED